MKITITLYCPVCQSAKILVLSVAEVNKNGKKPYFGFAQQPSNKQNFFCKNCHRQFVGNHNLSYKGCHSDIIRRILMMLVRGVGIRDISVIERISIRKVLSVLVKSVYVIKPKQSHYDCFEVDEFWTYVGKKDRKVWLVYAYHRVTGEIVAYVWGKRNLKTAKLLRKKLSELGVTYEKICSDDWKSFVTTFKDDGC